MMLLLSSSLDNLLNLALSGRFSSFRVFEDQDEKKREGHADNTREFRVDDDDADDDADADSDDFDDEDEDEDDNDVDCDNDNNIDNQNHNVYIYIDNGT